MSGGDSGKMLILPSDMLVEVAYPDDEVSHGAGRATAKCTYCIRNGDETEYPAHDVMMIRHWKANTPKEPDAGWWGWYCPEHYACTAPWASSLLAPEHLIPADLEARIAADREAAAWAEAHEFGKAEQAITLARLIPAGHWTTFGDIGRVVYGNTRSSGSVSAALTSLATSERCHSRVRDADGRCATKSRRLAQADEVALFQAWNEMAREDGLPVVTRTGVAFAAYRLSIADLEGLHQPAEYPSL
ncbi:hypothetical protein ACH3VR_03895 [Microbacterium sp. B2969]|uniref:PARP-type domain-containing protein n=1 Tax=Microbacterium alkaliflavum TaxID=3248839 RepID=A0ABW7Q7D1_9MICO